MNCDGRDGGRLDNRVSPAKVMQWLIQTCDPRDSGRKKKRKLGELGDLISAFAEHRAGASDCEIAGIPGEGNVFGLILASSHSRDY